MKRKDLLFFLCIVLFFSPFIFSHEVFDSYRQFNHDHGLITSFLKFAVLATLGEIIGLRIKTGNYYEHGFGILPRAVVWGFIGLTIKAAFIIFTSGTPVFLQYCGMKDAVQAFSGPIGTEKVFIAFCTSVAMNLVYAPVMMTFHKITDTHILSHNGKLSCLVRPIAFREIFIHLNWDVQWHFVFKKTIPFFWIPAHTITFLLPADYQVLFAAILGIMLGMILAIANKMDTSQPDTNK
jgi:hypothetical protein